MAQVIVITWAEKDGAEPTGATEYRDGCHRAVYRPAWKARAVVWSRDLDDVTMAKASAFAREHQGCARVMEDTADVLERARRIELELHR